MLRILKFVSVVTTFVLATGMSIAPANATTPTLTSPINASLVTSNLNLNYTLPENPLSGSVTVTIVRDTPASPAFSRTLTMSDATSMDYTFNPFATSNSILIGSAGKIASISSTPSQDVMPIGIYSVNLQYRTGSGTFAISSTGVTFTVPCDVGTFSTDGNVPVANGCTLAPRGSYVNLTGRTSATICDAGFFAINEGSAGCLPAPAGKFSTLGNGGVAPSECAAGTYQPSQGQSECLLARVGHYVSDTGQITDFVCPAGTYRLEAGQASCLDAPAGTYVSETGAHATFDCVAGTFSSSARSISCVQSPANFYVATVAATAATACPSGYTSPAGSDALTDCVAPVVAATPPIVKSSPSMLKGKKRTIKSLASEVKLAIPAKAKLSATVAKSSKQVCVVSGASIKALNRGTCVVTLKVKPTKGSSKSKTTRITIK